MSEKSKATTPWRLEYGARPVHGGVQFRVWAPRAKKLEVVIKSPRAMVLPMRADGGDAETFTAVAEGIGAGADYLYRIDGDRERPDPVSRWQPSGVHGPSRVVDPAGFRWTDSVWRGIELEDYLIYELHIGTFTREGTFAAAAQRLLYLRDAGITAVELMPVAQFPGARNWGYDGVFPYAVQSSYGGPEELKRLVDACHRAGLAVVMDVVYNHLGPDGNYLPEYMPCFSDRYRGPWGEAINYDGPGSDGIRRYVIENALYWMTEYHIDALRLDAVHAILDFGARHVMAELSERFHREAAALGRNAYLIAESDLDDVRVIRTVREGGWGMDVQWNDAFHHAVHTMLTGDEHGYFADYRGFDDLRKAMTEGYVYDWRYSRVRGRHHGSSSADRPGRQFVIFTQNHDQVANALAGRRAGAVLTEGEQKAAAALLLCAPNLPMLFMGQEYGASTIFTYFTDFSDPALARAVSEGRKREYAGFLDAGFLDPQSAEAFESSKLDWNQLTHPANQRILCFYRDLIALRKKLKPLSNCRKELARVEFDKTARWIKVERGDPSGERCVLLCSVNRDPVEVPITGALRLALFGGEEDAEAVPSEIGAKGDNVRFSGPGAALYVGRER